MCKSDIHPSLGVGAAIILCAVLSAVPAAAETMKPGLWEINNKMGGEAGSQMAAAQAQMQEQLASMPPEQRKMIQEMMAKQGVNAAPDGGISVRICVTKEMAERNQPPASNQGDCKQEQMERSGNTTKFKFTCTNPPSSGEGEVTLHNPESYSMKMNVTSQSTQSGRTGNMTMDAEGKFISSDCGSVKPING